MNPRPHNPSVYAMFFLFVGFGLLTLAFLICPDTILSMKKPGDLGPHCFIIAGAMVLARALAYFAETCLRQDLYPWYIRKGAIPYAIGLNLLFLPIYVGAFHTMPHLYVQGNLLAVSRFLEFLGAELFWIIFTGWPITGNSSTNNKHHDSQLHQPGSQSYLVRSSNYLYKSRDPEDTYDDLH